MDAYQKLKYKVDRICQTDHTFEVKASRMKSQINDLSFQDFIEIVINIGVIPEAVSHDSTAEKFYAKVSDMVLARAFLELGLKSHVLTARGDAADVYAESFYHGYSLVGDAKIFRLSRTAKNAKDFKIPGLNFWRAGNDYAVLCAPWYQYPTRSSQIYKEALDLNVALFSWEYLAFMLQNRIRESEQVNLANLWNYSQTQSATTVNADSKNRFLEQQNQFIEKYRYNVPISYPMQRVFEVQVASLLDRAGIEKAYWESVIAAIKGYSREQAISELLKEKKIDQRILQIDKTVKGAQKTFEMAN